MPLCQFEKAKTAMSLTLSDEQAAALRAKAAAEGLSLEEWIQKLAEPAPTGNGSLAREADLGGHRRKNEASPS